MAHILWLDTLTPTDIPSVGTGPVLLAQAKQAGHSVADGFVVTADVFFKHLLENDIREDLMEGCDIGGLSASVREERSKLLKDLVTASRIPWDMEMELLNAIKQLKSKSTAEQVFLSILFCVTSRRGIGSEDEALTLAEHPKAKSTFFLKDAEEIMDAIREGWSEYFCDDSILYRIENSLRHEDLAVVAMVRIGNNPKSSGLAYPEVDHEDEDKVLVEAIYGLPLNVGTELDPDRLVIDPIDGTINKKLLSSQTWKYGRGSAGNLAKFTIKKGYQSSLKVAETRIKSIRETVLDLKTLFSMPVGMLWSQEGEKIWIEYLCPYNKHVISERLSVLSKAAEEPEPEPPAPEETSSEGGDMNFFGALFSESTTTTPVETTPAAPMRVIPIPDDDDKDDDIQPMAMFWGGADDAADDVTLPADIDLDDDVLPSGAFVTGTSLYLLLDDPDKVGERDLTKSAPQGVLILDDKVMTEAYFGTHPLQIIVNGEEDRYVELLSARLQRLATAVDPKPLVVKCTDWGSEVALGLKGAKSLPLQSGKSLGPRGAALFQDKEIKVAFKLELKAIERAMSRGVTNLIVVLPFVRTGGEVETALSIMRSAGLAGKPLGVYAEVVAPGPILDVEELAPLLDGIVVDLDQLIAVSYGIDPTAARAEILAHVEKEAKSAATFQLLSGMLKIARRSEMDVIVHGQRSLADPRLLDILMDGPPTAVAAPLDVADETMAQVARAERARLMKYMSKVASKD